MPSILRTTLYCHTCRKFTKVESDHQSDHDEDDTYTCLACGEQVQCDECGGIWSDKHDCVPATPLRVVR